MTLEVFLILLGWSAVISAAGVIGVLMVAGCAMGLLKAVAMLIN